jgi:PEP-CTERM motif-containing protein
MLKNTRPQRASNKREAPDLLNALHPSVFGTVAAAVIALLSAVPGARAAVINVVDVIPNSDSAEALQNSEPSLGVNPLNPSQMIAGTFGNGPYFKSTNGGTIWSGYGNLAIIDKSIAWRQDGVAALTVTLQDVSPVASQFQTYSGTIGASNFGAPIDTFSPGQLLDQPWIRTGPSGQTYVAYNNYDNAGGRSASIRVSADNGGTFAPPVTLETVDPAAGQDAPPVRQAVSGSTVYAAFTRWGDVIQEDANGVRFGNSQVVVVKSTNSGAAFSAGVVAATTTGSFSLTNNSPLSLGQERAGSDVAIAVDPNNANRVVVAYTDAPGADDSGLLQLHVIESTDGGATWTNKFTTSAAVRSALPALSILSNGAIGLLYASYDPITNQLTQHLLTTTNDFAATDDSLLGTESNAFPTIQPQFGPYIGDFFDLTSVGDIFYGIFSASNADNGIDALFPDVSFQRDFIGAPGTAGFHLTSAIGAPDFSIDPFVFSFSLAAVVPEPATVTLLGAALIGMAALRRRHRQLVWVSRILGNGKGQ